LILYLFKNYKNYFIGKIKVLKINVSKVTFYRGLELYADRDYAEAKNV
jgi:hypothetical protein